jgi:microcystin-dependent protein
MPPFGTGSGVGDTYASVLLTFPDVDWFRWNIAGAINQMTLDYTWSEDGDVGISFAIEEAKKTLESMVFMAFNPIPVGLIHPFGAAVEPAGYLLCDGASYATADYPELFAVIAYTYGGAGANFNVPALINRVVVGSGDLWSIGATGGEQDVFLDVAALPSHTHIDSGHQHSIPLVTSLPAQAGAGFAGNVTVPVITDSTGLSFANNGNTGGDGSHNNMQPFQAVPYIIYAGR